MANPITAGLGIVGMGASLFGGFMGAQGAQVSAAAQQSAANAQASAALYQAQIANQNQVIANQNASYARYAGEVEAQQSAMATREQIGQTRAQQGAGNLDVNSGTNVNVRMSMAEVGEENVALIRSQAAKQAYGDTVQAIQFGEQSQMDTTQASYDIAAGGFAKTAGDINATTSILGAVGSAAGMGVSAFKSGIFG